MTSTTVSLSLPDTPDVNRLLEMYHDLLAKFDLQKKALDQSLYGVLLDKEFYDMVTACYPTDAVAPMVTGNTFMHSMIQPAVERISFLVQRRYDAAASGAMRWPWSQEARINDELRYD